MLKAMKNRIENAYLNSRYAVSLLLSFVMISTSGPLLAADFDAGLQAFRERDMEQALEEWHPLAQAGESNAQHALGMMYEYGYGLARDDAEAAKWYEKAAVQNMPEAQYRLGVFYDNGWGGARDADLAAKWYTRAAHLGHAFAQHDLAYMHLNGTGVPKDKILAYKWLKIASKQRSDLMEKHLFNVSKTMTASEIFRAERLVQAWLRARDI